MIARAVSTDLHEMMQFTEETLTEGLYVYLNLRSYGLNNPNIDFWLVRDELSDVIVGIVMKYYWGVTALSQDDSSVLPYLLDLVAEIMPMTLMGRLDLIEQVNQRLVIPYSLNRGWVYNLSNYRSFSAGIEILRPSREEMLEVAEFLFAEEDTQSHYPNPEALAVQLVERYDNNSGCNFIIREDGIIIAHIGSYAKGFGIGTTAGLYVDAQHRDIPYGTILESYLVDALKEEGLVPYTFIYNPKRAKLLNAVGAKVCCEHGIMTREK